MMVIDDGDQGGGDDDGDERDSDTVFSFTDRTN
jgi:hypothetical protein